VGAVAAPSAFDLAGRYTRSFQNGAVEGGGYRSTDEVTIVATDARHAAFDIHLYFYNGHECHISGIATLEGGEFVSRDPEMTGYGDGGPCTLRIRRADQRIAWSDAGTCSGYCGARGSLNGGGISMASRHPMSRAAQRRFLQRFQRGPNQQ
jgi:hypothetical protein